MWYNTLKNNLRELIEDETGYISSARCGLWITVILAIICVSVDIHLSLAHSTVQLPNTVYALLATMFTVFAAWAGGARVAQYIGPQIGSIAQGISSATQKSSNTSTVGEITQKVADKLQSMIENGSIKTNEKPI